MRPEVLYPLFKPVTSLSGVGPRISTLVEKTAGGARLVDLCFHLPNGIIDRRFSPKVADAPIGALVTLIVRVDAHHPAPKRRLPYKVLCADETGFVTLAFFHARPEYLQSVLPAGETRVVSGRIEDYAGERQMVHPDQIGTLDELDDLRTVEPIYPLTAGLTAKPMRKAVRGALGELPDLPEWLDPAYQKKQNWPAWRDAVLAAHTPGEETDLALDTTVRRRLAFDELLANQLALGLIRAHWRKRPGRPIKGCGSLREKVLGALPFELTGAQHQAGAEIAADMAAPTRMMRLLQGDVGSGKTIVALLAMLAAVEEGAQAALMAPTEILARQHHAVLAPLAEGAKVRLAVLTGRDKGKAREAILADLAAGDIDILVGTHALFQKGVEFSDLAMAVIDEQHRFGVHQRLALAKKGSAEGQRSGTPDAVDILLMTATPIPRSLAITAYGDLEISQLKEKPPGRKPIDTRTLPLTRLENVAAGLERAIDTGARIYWVCPLVAESEVLDLAAAEERYEHLSKLYPGRTGLVHGQMKPAQRDEVMSAFAAGSVDVLVATTVIEVGVDVPEATIMVIEHAERFGLAQLHQLRGRVGRSSDQSSCLLLYAAPLGEAARARLNIMRETEDGFRIAEEDLRLRGAGDVLGTKQSGLPEFRLADIAVHEDLLMAARDDARLILERDGGLDSARGDALRVLLYLFERETAVRYLRSG